MSKFKNNVGDVFEIPIEINKIGYGRILIIDYPIIFCEFYNIIPSKKYTLNELKEKETILSIWCSNHGLRKGEWNVVGNIPIETEVILPYFWKKDAFNPNQILLVPGEYFMKEDEDAHSIVTTAEKRGDSQPYGVFGHDAVKIRYSHELEKNN
ncbi:Imm26 family immunity protein [Pseudalkalibacillus sp. SCS-8]|uniref:Imm26 family immunity protein n=1 Tax=Pseudalkalibacillus nanhaiensis TaxID=3115291 RepID=UPI0032DA75CD